MTVPVFRVLVVDDNLAIQQDFRKIFAARSSRNERSEAESILFGEDIPDAGGADFRLEMALQGREGIAKVRQSLVEEDPYAMAFVDVRMPPGLDGIATTEEIWRLDPHIQVVICTAYSDYSWSDMLTRLGRSDQLVILKKPFDTIEVLQLASALTEKWRLANEARLSFGLLERRVEERTTELARMAEQLQVSEAQYRLLFENNPHPMWVFVRDTLRFVMVNHAATARYGYPEERFLAMTLLDLQLPGAEPGLRAAIAASPNEGKRFRLTKHRTSDGSVIDVEVSSDAMVFDGRPARLALAHDVTERMQADVKVKRLNRVYAVLSGINTLIVRADGLDELLQRACEIAVDHGGFRMAGIGTVDESTSAVTVSASAGMPASFVDLLGSHLSQVQVAPSGRANALARVLSERRVVFSNDIRIDADSSLGDELGELGVRSVAILPLRVAGRVANVMALYSTEPGFFDEVELKLLAELAGNIAFAVDHLQKQDRLEFLARHDVLTGLANRAQFVRTLAEHMLRASGRAGKLALYLLDVERFRNINETLGRDAGDALLRQLAQFVVRHAGDAVFASRVGADQFALVLPSVDRAEDAARVVTRMAQAVMDHEFRLDQGSFRIAVRAGIALFPDDGTDADVLFGNAEAALNAAKLSAERYLFFTTEMTESVKGRLALENQLRLALERNEFVLHYQPKVALESGNIVGAEALIRWNDPLTGLVPPDRFIPVLEETGLIHQVGHWALKQAVSDYLRWRRAGLPAVPISVNVSALQLRRLGFVDEIANAISVDPAAAAGLEIELTESMVMDDLKRSVLTLQAIRDMGVTIAIDDFGTGFSSLSYLARLPVNALKIDRSFVADLTSSQDGMALVSTIINLGHSLKLKIIAEGVESEVQSRVLAALGCDEMQGYLFSRPVAAAIFEARFLRRRAVPVATVTTDGVPVGA